LVLQLYIDDKLVDQSILSSSAMKDEQTREVYVQGAMTLLLEPWEDLIKEYSLQSQFFIKTNLEAAHISVTSLAMADSLIYPL
jgi:hypothetical protein